MARLLVLQGLPASGKTTYAKDLVDDGYIRVNKDDLRKMLNNGQHSKQNEARVIRLRDTVVIDALANGRNVVVDDTNFNPVHIQTLRGIAQQFDAKFHVSFINTPLEECIKRNAEREDSVPENVIHEMYERYVKPHEIKPPENDEELEEAIIVDVDGTLANIDSANPRNVYDASRAMEDLCDDAVASVVSMAYQNGYKVIILTGRHGGHLQVTKDWLEKCGIPYDEIYSRQEGDNRKDSIIKKELFNRHIAGKYQVKFVLDDRNQVVDMWRNELGLKCFQVQPGDF